MAYEPLPGVFNKQFLDVLLNPTDLLGLKNAAFAGISGRRVRPDSLIRISSMDSLRTTFIFLINPGRVNSNKPRIENYILTKAGFERYWWANDLWIFQYSGTTGAFVPDVRNLLNAPPEGYDITQTPAWQKFQEFEQFYLARQEEDLSLYSPIHIGQLTLLGSVASFTYDQDANDPFQIKYSFTFKGFPNLTPTVVPFRDLESGAGQIPQGANVVLSPGPPPGSLVA